jgi:hypothetical protein
MAQNALPDEAKLFVVQQLACWDTPSEVARAVNEEFGIEVSRQAVERYDPTKRMGQSLSAEFRQIFDATRKAFLEDTASIGISHRTVRLRTLQRMALKAEEMKNLPFVADLLERAAKEMGNAYTNRREITGANGGAVKLISTGMTPKEAAESYAATLHGDD